MALLALPGPASRMFTVHMLQHLVLLDFLPVLLLLSLDARALRAAAARAGRVAALIGAATSPAIAVGLYAGTLWIIHIPALFELALQWPALHFVQHLALVCVGLLFWAHVASPVQPRRHLKGPAVAAYMASAKLLTGALSTVIIFTGFAQYDWYADQSRLAGLSWEEDRQVAGGAMMIWELFVLASAFAAMFIRMLSESEREERDREDAGSAT